MENKRKKIYIIIVLTFAGLLIGNSCKHQKSTDKNSSSFYLKVYDTGSSIDVLTLTWLNKNNESFTDTLQKHDENFTIHGKVPYPVKGYLESPQSREYFPFILHNDTVIIKLSDNHLYNSSIEKSDLNMEWQNIVKTSEKNYKEINYLFPKIQKARLQNDHVTLESIYKEIEAIKNEQKVFLIEYIEKHPQSKLNPIILNDLYINYPKDSLMIKSKVDLLNSQAKIGLIDELLN